MAADDVHRLWVRIFERASQLPRRPRRSKQSRNVRARCQIEIEKFLT
jgi:hypothetical protein